MAFDFDAFVAGTELPVIPIPLVRKDRSAQINRLQAALDKMPTAGDERESDTDERAPLRDQIAALRAEQDASVEVFDLRSLNAQEFRDVVQNDERDVFDQIAAQSKGTKNEGSREQWEKVAAAVTAYQWGLFVAAANDLVLTKVAMPDFSQNDSETPSPQASSAN